MTAGQAPGRRSPCPRPAPQGTSIPCSHRLPSHQKLPAPEHRATTFPYTHTHTPCPAVIPDWDPTACSHPAQRPALLLTATHPANACSPSPKAHCLPPPPAPRNLVILLAPRCPHAAPALVPCRPGRPGSAGGGTGRREGSLPGRSTALPN